MNNYGAKKSKRRKENRTRYQPYSRNETIARRYRPRNNAQHRTHTKDRDKEISDRRNENNNAETYSRATIPTNIRFEGSGRHSSNHEQQKKRDKDGEKGRENVQAGAEGIDNFETAPVNDTKTRCRSRERSSHQIESGVRLPHGTRSRDRSPSRLESRGRSWDVREPKRRSSHNLEHTERERSKTRCSSRPQPWRRDKADRDVLCGYAGRFRRSPAIRKPRWEDAFVKNLRSSCRRDASGIIIELNANQAQLNKFLQKSKEDIKMTVSLLQALDKAFTSQLLPATLVKLIDIIETNDLIANSVQQLEPYIEQGSTQSTFPGQVSVLEALSFILRIVIKICGLKPSSITFIEGSFKFISDLMNKLIESSRQEDKRTGTASLKQRTETCYTETNPKKKEISDEEVRDCEDKSGLWNVGKTSLPVIQNLFEELTARRDDILHTGRKGKKDSEELKRTTEITEDSFGHFRYMSVIPDINDLHGKTDSKLRPNKATGAYASVDDYLDVQFRLLREDFVQPLRDGVRALRGWSTGRCKRKIQEIKIYENVRIDSMFYGDGLTFILTFDVSKLKHVRWNMSKRLKYGSLICLSSDNFETCLFGTITNTDASELRNGRVQVKFSAHWKSVRLLFGMCFTMIESSAYFEAYRPVLEGLQNVSENLFPFKRYFVDCLRNIDPPKYWFQSPDNVTFDLRCLFHPFFSLHSTAHDNRTSAQENRTNLNEEEMSRFIDINILEDNNIIENKLPFDPSQLKAFKSALTKELAIIQGPPGCGKTYVGLQIANTLLSNRYNLTGSWCTQLLVVCYTNHALDQFLEGIWRMFDGDILRVGRRSRSQILRPCFLSEKRDYFRQNKLFPKTIYKGRVAASREFMLLKKQMNIAAYEIKIVKQNIVNENYLRNEMGLFFDQFVWYSIGMTKRPLRLRFLGYSPLVDWLGIAAKAKEIQNDIHYSDKEENLDNEVDDMINFEEREILNEEFCTEIGTDATNELEKFKCNHLALDLDLIQIALDENSTANEMRKAGERRLLARWVKKMLLKASTFKVPQSEKVDVFRLKLQERWALYWHWIRTKCETKNINLASDLDNYEETYKRLKEAIKMEDKYLFENADVIGMTTTGAAKYQDILEDVKPAIVIVEEAAEVLESHIISTLSSGCRQLILIGDHKQLKPKTNVYKLETDYNMDISLFERMIRNRLPYDCLQVQHRMRPFIADNIRFIYGNLEDHEHVMNYDDIVGIKHNVFFLNHTEPEMKDSELKSFTNEHEVFFTLALCNYLLLQGYDPSQITILTTYAGQMFLFKKTVNCHYDMLKLVRISTVDEYQGEESEIILLSLVRSNFEGKIGYVARENRICVALSRARKGLYVIGNFGILEKASGTWKQVVSKMKNKNLVGDTLTLCCQNHPNDEGIAVKSQEDFNRAPEGGCDKKCEVRLECGHACDRFCHNTDREHKNIQCKKPCLRECSNGHRCSKLCFVRCFCDADVTILLSKCGHQLTMKCSKTEKFEEMKYECKTPCDIVMQCGHTCTRECFLPCVCMVQVRKRLPICNHEVEILCSVNPKHFRCRENCTKKLPCGHSCRNRCGEVCGPCKEGLPVCLVDCRHEHMALCGEDLSRVLCQKVCELNMDCGHPCKCVCSNKTIEIENLEQSSSCPAGHISFCIYACKERLKCGHVCKGNCKDCFQGRWHMQCTEPCNCSLACGHTCSGICEICSPCKEPCTRRCLHRICSRNCTQICEPCQKPCQWSCEHKKCTKICGQPCDRERCNEPCRSLLGCGHECIGMCGDPCPNLCRECNYLQVKKLHFGREDEKDSRFVQLRDCGHIIRYDLMDEYMDIDEGLTIKRCPLCREPIRNTLGNRYEKVLNDFHRKLDLLKWHMLQYPYPLTDFNVLKSAELFTKMKLTGQALTLSTKRDWLLKLNVLNQIALSGFIRTSVQKNKWSRHRARLFPPGQTLMSSPQKVAEIEREVRRYVDTCLINKLREDRTESADTTESAVGRDILKEAFAIIKKKTAYSDQDRSMLQECLDKLPNKKVSYKLLDVSILACDQNHRIEVEKKAKLRILNYYWRPKKVLGESISHTLEKLTFFQMLVADNKDSNSKIESTGSCLSFKEACTGSRFSFEDDSAESRPSSKYENKESHLAFEEKSTSLSYGDENIGFKERDKGAESDIDKSGTTQSSTGINCLVWGHTLQNTAEPEDAMIKADDNPKYVVRMVIWHRRPYYDCNESFFHLPRLRQQDVAPQPQGEKAKRRLSQTDKNEPKLKRSRTESPEVKKVPDDNSTSLKENRKRKSDNLAIREEVKRSRRNEASEHDGKRSEGTPARSNPDTIMHEEGMKRDRKPETVTADDTTWRYKYQINKSVQKLPKIPILKHSERIAECVEKSTVPDVRKVSVLKEGAASKWVRVQNLKVRKGNDSVRDLRVAPLVAPDRAELKQLREFQGSTDIAGPSDLRSKINTCTRKQTRDDVRHVSKDDVKSHVTEQPVDRKDLRNILKAKEMTKQDSVKSGGHRKYIKTADLRNVINLKHVATREQGHYSKHSEKANGQNTNTAEKGIQVQNVQHPERSQGRRDV